MLCAGAAQATTVLITTAKTIGPGDTTITPSAGGAAVPLAEAEIVVDTANGVLTINRPEVVTIQSLTVRTSGKVQPAAGVAIYLNVTGAATVEATGAINGDGKGYLGSTASNRGPGAGIGAAGNAGGGGGYGGAGGDGYGALQVTLLGGLGGGCYDYRFGDVVSSLNGVTFPTQLGSRGGNLWSGGVENLSTGGLGGGAIRLSVGGTLTVNGTISARGVSGTDNSGTFDAGSGSGGSIFLTCGTIGGSGSIDAGGGIAGTWNGQGGGGGGGGRIAVFYGAISPGSTIPTLQAAGGDGNGRGGAGTIYTKLNSVPRGTITIDNGSTGGETTELVGPLTWDADVVTQNGGYLGPYHGQTNFDLTVTGNVTLNNNSGISANGRGRLDSNGPGTGTGAAGYAGGGGGYGGAGGDGYNSLQATLLGGLGGGCYAYEQSGVTAPTHLGSRGGNLWSGGVEDLSMGGLGGGAIRLSVGGTLTVIGTISARGVSGTDNSGTFDAGSGSGGSIFVACGTIIGSVSGVSGAIDAGGGIAGTWNGQGGGGGGGGRVAVLYGGGTLPTLQAAGGDGNGRGGAGTIYTKLNSVPRGTITIDNGSTGGETTELVGPLTWDADVVIQNGGLLGPYHGQTDFNLTVTGNVTVNSNAGVYANGRGYPGSTGPGAGGSVTGVAGGGGGYGGRGGKGFGASGAPGGQTYGAEWSPVDGLLGSGGGNIWNQAGPIAGSGGWGGGAIRMFVGGALTVNGNGSISARGFSGTDNSGTFDAGSGSGGSIFLTCGTIGGSGSIDAGGGIAGTWNGQGGGGGGGGRTVLVTCDGSTVPHSEAGGAGGSGGSQPGSFIVSTAPYVAIQPVATQRVRECASSAQVSVRAFGNTTGLTYQWKMLRNTAPFISINLTNGTGQLPGISFSGVNSPVLTLTPTGDFDSTHLRSFSCVVTGCSGSVITGDSVINGIDTCCPADLDNGSGAGTPDNAITIDDLLYFLFKFEIGSPAADLDNDGDPAVGTPDGAVTIDDLLFFLVRFEAGC